MLMNRAVLLMALICLPAFADEPREVSAELDRFAGRYVSELTVIENTLDDGVRTYDPKLALEVEREGDATLKGYTTSLTEPTDLRHHEKIRFLDVGKGRWKHSQRDDGPWCCKHSRKAWLDGDALKAETHHYHDLFCIPGARILSVKQKYELRFDLADPEVLVFSTSGEDYPDEVSRFRKAP
jgi:hypothetical protein